jgi:hypothetical protein
MMSALSSFSVLIFVYVIVNTAYELPYSLIVEICHDFRNQPRYLPDPIKLQNNRGPML